MPVAKCFHSMSLANRRWLPGAAMLLVLASGGWTGLAAAEDATASDAGEKVAAKADDEPVEWSCRYERPTGSRKAVKVCRDKKGIEAGAEISRQSLRRAQHYGNPTVTPQG